MPSTPGFAPDAGSPHRTPRTNVTAHADAGRHRTFNGWGYSPFDRSDRENVGALRMVWSRAQTEGQPGRDAAGVRRCALTCRTGRRHPRRSTPRPAISSGSTAGITPRTVTEVRRQPHDEPGTSRCTAGHIIDTSVDNRVSALDAETGRLAWETPILDYTRNPARHSSGPIIVGGKIVSGRSCIPRGGPEACVITAHDATTGEEIWRRHTVPAQGERGGIPFEERVHVGSWIAASYDPVLSLVYVRTSVTSPAPKFLLGGADNQHLDHNSTPALDGDTGEMAGTTSTSTDARSPSSSIAVQKILQVAE